MQSLFIYFACKEISGSLVSSFYVPKCPSHTPVEYWDCTWGSYPHDTTAIHTGILQLFGTSTSHSYALPYAALLCSTSATGTQIIVASGNEFLGRLRSKGQLLVVLSYIDVPHGSPRHSFSSWRYPVRVVAIVPIVHSLVWNSPLLHALARRYRSLTCAQ